LQERTSKSRSTLNAKLKDQVSLQLAYAQIKTYKQAGFDAAEADLFTAEMDASKAGDTELMLQAKSIRVFLYAVLAGHATEELRKLEGAKNAIQLGNELLEQAPEGSRPAVRFEALNALGIAWMRVGEAHWEAIGDKATSWAKAQKYYDEALEIIPNSLRVLQNLAKLRLLQVEQLKDKNARTLLEQAKEYCERSLDVSDQDMYPYYLLAQIEAKLGYLVKNEDERPYFMAAWEYVHIGRGRPGAVTEEQWAEVERTLPRSADSNQPYKR
jgi:tetratricopeptide (TPR) repeat protein